MKTSCLIRSSSKAGLKNRGVVNARDNRRMKRLKARDLARRGVAGGLRSPALKGADMIAPTRIDDAVCTLKGIFLEVPRLELTVEQACALTGLDRPTCRVLLKALEQARFLWQPDHGRFVLRPDWTTIES
jgi:hypothetical protein